MIYWDYDTSASLFVCVNNIILLFNSENVSSQFFRQELRHQGSTQGNDPCLSSARLRGQDLQIIPASAGSSTRPLLGKFHPGSQCGVHPEINDKVGDGFKNTFQIDFLQRLNPYLPLVQPPP